MDDSFIVSAERSGGTTPGSFPHLCPYRPTGASREFCHEITSNLQRNMAGCCGTQDYRNFAPCNSSLRKCIRCLSTLGSKAKTVVDVKRGLCLEHSEEADHAVAVPTPTQAPRRSGTYLIPPSRREGRPKRRRIIIADDTERTVRPPAPRAWAADARRGCWQARTRSRRDRHARPGTARPWPPSRPGRGATPESRPDR